MRSKRRNASCIPPMPSVNEWCTFMTRAARSPTRCSTRVNRQRGRDRSNPVMASIRANSTTVAGVRGLGAATRRRCNERSN